MSAFGSWLFDANAERHHRALGPADNGIVILLALPPFPRGGRKIGCRQRRRDTQQNQTADPENHRLIERHARFLTSRFFDVKLLHWAPARGGNLRPAMGTVAGSA